MEPFKSHRGIVAVLDRANVDTDLIIPKQFLKSISRTGFGDKLFFDARYLADGKPNPDFPLNQDRFKGASILVARNNFGCGSSREHAVWAVKQFGLRVLVAPWITRDKARIAAFADIFKNNCLQNGILTIELAEGDVNQIFQSVEATKRLEATADLEKETLTLHGPQTLSFRFKTDFAAREKLLSGMDDIGLTLKLEDKIRAFEAKHDNQMT